MPFTLSPGRPTLPVYIRENTWSFKKNHAKGYCFVFQVCLALKNIKQIFVQWTVWKFTKHTAKTCANCINRCKESLIRKKMYFRNSEQPANIYMCMCVCRGKGVYSIGNSTWRTECRKLNVGIISLGWRHRAHNVHLKCTEQHCKEY